MNNKCCSVLYQDAESHSQSQSLTSFTREKDRRRESVEGRGWEESYKIRVETFTFSFDVRDIEEDRGQHEGNTQKGEQGGEHTQNSSDHETNLKEE